MCYANTGSIYLKVYEDESVIKYTPTFQAILFGIKNKNRKEVRYSESKKLNE